MIEPDWLRHLGADIAALRERAGLNQARLARRSGSLHPPQISRYEQGHEEPRVSTLVKYLAAAGADFADLQLELESRASGGSSGTEAKFVLDGLAAETGRRYNVDPDLRQEVAELIARFATRWPLCASGSRRSSAAKTARTAKTTEIRRPGTGFRRRGNRRQVR